MDVRQFYLSVASGRVGFRSLLHTAFRVSDNDDDDDNETNLIDAV